MSFTPAFARLLAVQDRRRFPSDSVSAVDSESTTLPGRPAGADKYPPDVRTLFLAGEKMLSSARRRGQSVALLVLQIPDLPELELVFGREPADQVVDMVMTELTHVSARRGIAVRTDAGTFALVMPAITGEDLERALQARAGRACAVELEWDEHEVLLVPDVQSRSVAESESIAHAYRAVCNALEAERTPEQRRQNYLRGEREGHTVPAMLRRSAPDSHAVGDKCAYHGYPAQPATIPLALSRPERRML